MEWLKVEHLPNKHEALNTKPQKCHLKKKKNE
jgi:hypothetical protein